MRDRIQDEAVKSWWKTKRGTVVMPTGAGKNFVALKIAKDFVGKKVLHLSERTDREQTFKAEIKKFKKLYKVNLPEVTYACYQSAYKWKDTYWDLVIADEVHDSLSSEYVKFYYNNDYDGILGLTATPDLSTGVGDVTREDYLNDLFPIVYKLSISDARDYGMLPNLQVFTVLHRLDAVKKTIEGGNKKKTFKTTEARSYAYWDSKFWEGVYMNNEFIIKNAARKRAELLYKLPSKIEVTKQIVNSLQGKTIVFGNSLDSLLKVTPNVVSSRNTDLQNEKIKRRYNDGSINVLGSFKKLKQGINLDGLDNVVMMSYYSKSLDFIQRSGRIRAKDSNFVGNLIILKTIGTKEDDWYNKMLTEVESSIICDGFFDFKLKYNAGRL